MTAFLAFTAVLVLTPGAATAVVVRNVLERGHRGGMAAALGVAAGNTSHAALAAIGLAAAFQRAPVAYAVLRYGGALYLLNLGVRSLAGAWRAVPATMPGGLERAASRPAPRWTTAGVRQGFVTALLNPAVATFYLIVVPTFLPGTPLMQRRFALYAAIHVSMAFAAHCAWVAGWSSLRSLWARPLARRIVETTTGAALVYLAWRVAAPDFT